MRPRAATAISRTSPRLETLSQLVATFATHGERPAVIAFRSDGVEEWSYARLGAEITRAARALRARGVGPGHRVALWAPNSPDWIVAYFAIVSSGATAVPVDHQSTPQSAAAALAHATPSLLLTTRAQCAELRAAGDSAPPDCVLLDSPASDGWPALCGVATTADLPVPGAADVASLLFTSGTTGTPKAVPLTHANLAGNTRELLAARLIGPHDRVLLPLPFHHTYPFTAGLLTALASGATVILPAGISGPEISRAAAEAGATALLAVPRLCTALWDSVLAAVRARGRAATTAFRGLLAVSIAARRLTGLHIGRWLFRAVHARLGPSLTLIGCGGAKLPADLTWKLEGLGFTVLTGYGLTETSPVLTFNSRRHSRLGSEGRALPGVELRIAATPGQTQGEIQAQGPSVFGGYWNNAEANAAAFTADGWFQTGDLGRIDADGYLYVVGRNKELIVLPDGKKLFPETVEKLYAASPLVREIAIFEHDGVLAALIVPNEQAVLERGALREAALLREELEDIAARLAPYQRLGAYRITRTPLPRTQLGKLKRHLLPALFAEADVASATATALVTNTADRELLDSPRPRAAWQWLEQRYPARPLTLDTSPQLDLQIDSLEWVTLTIEIERRFGVVLTGEALSRILTLRDLLREIAAAPPATARTATPTRAFVPPGPLLRALGAGLYALLRLVMRLAWRVEVAGIEELPERGPLLITPNHCSYLDPPTLAAALPWRQLRRTYWAGWVGVMHTNPLRRLLSRATQVFPIDPDRDLAGAVRTAQELLQRGYAVVWFPEGRRSPNGELQPFQAGIGVLTQGAVATVVPTAIHGTFAAWPKQQRWPQLRWTLSVRFGQPLSHAARDNETFRRSLEHAVRELLKQRPEGSAGRAEHH